MVRVPVGHGQTVDPHARFMRNKSWPYWEHWQIIFGNDRAVGIVSEDYMDAVNGLYKRCLHFESGSNSAPPVSLEDVVEGDPFSTSHTPDGQADSNRQGTPTNNDSKGGGGKGKAIEGIEGLMNLLEKLHDNTNARLESLATRTGYESHLRKARKEAYELLGRLPGLTRDQKFDGGEIILVKLERLDFFLGMPEEDRLAYALTTRKLKQEFSCLHDDTKYMEFVAHMIGYLVKAQLNYIPRKQVESGELFHLFNALDFIITESINASTFAFQMELYKKSSWRGILVIPSEWTDAHGGDVPTESILKMPNGLSWPVTITRSRNGWQFAGEWRIDYFMATPYWDDGSSSDESEVRWSMPTSASYSTIPSFTILLLASDLEGGLVSISAS
ncbi:hypothetical protein SASPL_123569 [Salvia splendens]|uniref:Uncharacterized protein n=1 Tax=Salvia splendens TaxID=180675 RepID=A0A8X8XKL8_SALSN|nr:hypothetical protein SASPL_123569 [Salvia splendens]